MFAAIIGAWWFLGFLIWTVRLIVWIVSFLYGRRVGKKAITS